jgi:molecular chaperone DnaK (HSP70)
MIYGIDLGTTYSCISRINEYGKAEIIPNAEGDQTTPSVVYFESPNSIIVGKQAKSSAKLFPDRCVSLVKRFMGNPDYTFPIDGKVFRPEEISSLILRKLVKDASEYTREEITDVVITCPAYFGIAEREATKKAGQLANLNVRFVLNEPTAAALTYGVERADQDQVVLVYDFGGGTFDITLIQITTDAIKVVYTAGDHSLGGADFDRELVSHMADDFRAGTANKSFEKDLLDDNETVQLLTNEAEEAKKGLAARTKWPVAISHEGVRHRMEITRDQFEELTRNLLQRTIDLTRAAIEASTAKDLTRIDKILLVGGSSKMPAVAARLSGEFEGPEIQIFEPDLAVAKGAALQGARLLAGDAIRNIIENSGSAAGEFAELSQLQQRQVAEAAAKSGQDGLRLTAEQIATLVTKDVQNVCSKGFGMRVKDAQQSRFIVDYPIVANTPVPAEETRTYYTEENGQRSVCISIREPYDKDSPEVDATREICQGELSDLPPGLKKGSPIVVTFRLEDDGTLRVTAAEPKSQKQVRLETKVIGTMTDQEVRQSTERMLMMTVS